MRKASTELSQSRGLKTPSPAPDLIPAETKNQPRTNIRCGTANGGTSIANSGTENPIGRLIILTDSLPGRKIPAAKPEAKLGGPQRLSIIATEPSVSTGRA